MKALFVAIALAVALTAAPVAYSQTVDTKADIQKATNEWMDAYNKKDAAMVAKIYSADATMSVPGWTASGQAAIEDGMKKDMAAGVFSKVTSDHSRPVAPCRRHELRHGCVDRRHEPRRQGCSSRRPLALRIQIPRRSILDDDA